MKKLLLIGALAISGHVVMAQQHRCGTDEHLETLIKQNPSIKDAKTKFEAENFVVSALFGLISITDQIPVYRLSGDTVVPKIGSLTKFWSESVSALITDQDEFVIDLRSGNYVKLGPIGKDIADQVVVPRIMQKMTKGAPKVVSHSNKATKGRLVRALAQSAKSVTSIEQLADITAKVALDVEVIKPAKAGTPWGLDVIVEVL